MPIPEVDILVVPYGFLLVFSLIFYLFYIYKYCLVGSYFFFLLDSYFFFFFFF